jgi:hypothetical protein
MKDHQDQQRKQSGISTSRRPGLAALLGNSLDYAGMFPPAGLPLEDAVRRYAAHLSGPEAWILSRFVCPARRLRELDAFLPLFRGGAPLRVSALAPSSPTSRKLHADLREAVRLLSEFQRIHYPRAVIDSVEISLPADLAGPDGRFRIPELITEIAESLGASGVEGATVFYEATADWGGLSGATLEAIAAHDSGAAVPAAFKLRTGGVAAEAFPSIDRVAYTIASCQELGVAFKCTAGLHHPVRRDGDIPGTKMHGFLNVFVAAALAHVPSNRGLDLRTVLADEDASNFSFDGRGLAWRDLRVPLAGISAARRRLILSFGSCSVEEPLDDLKVLRIL